MNSRVSAKAKSATASNIHSPFRSKLGSAARSMMSLGFACLFLCSTAHGQSKPLSADDQKALRETQELMRDPKRLEKEGLVGDKAKEAHANVKALTGNEQDTAAVFALAADIFAPLVQDAGGDPTKMQQILTQALKDPGSFASKLTPDQQRRLKEIERKIEARQPSNSPR